MIGVATLTVSLRDVRTRSIILARGFASLRLESIRCRSLRVFALRLLSRGFRARSLFLARGFDACRLLIARGFGAGRLFLAHGIGTSGLLVSRGFGACRLLPLRGFLSLCFELRRGEAIGFLALRGGEPFVRRFPFRLLSRRFSTQFLLLARGFGARSRFVPRGFGARSLFVPRGLEASFLFLPRGLDARCLLRACCLLSLCFELRHGEALGLSTLRIAPLRLDAGCFIPSCSFFAHGCRLLLAFNFETPGIDLRRCESLSLLSLGLLSLGLLSLSLLSLSFASLGLLPCRVGTRRLFLALGFGARGFFLARILLALRRPPLGVLAFNLESRDLFARGGFSTRRLLTLCLRLPGSL